MNEIGARARRDAVEAGDRACARLVADLKFVLTQFPSAPTGT